MKTRGRPFKEPHQRVSECINSRLTVEEIALLEALAEHEGETVSRTIRKLVVGSVTDKNLRVKVVESFDTWQENKL